MKKPRLTQITLTQFDDGSWSYFIRIDGFGQPQTENNYGYHDQVQALAAANKEFSRYVPLPPEESWERRLENLKKELGIDPA